MDKITRADGLELGGIIQVAETPKSQYGCYEGSGTWMATSKIDGKSKYFVHYPAAIHWLERKAKNTYPISRLAEYINGGI